VRTWCEYEDEGGVALGVTVALLHVEGRGFDEQWGELLGDELLDTRYLVNASNYWNRNQRKEDEKSVKKKEEKRVG
jgi:hypothetical protein